MLYTHIYTDEFITTPRSQLPRNSLSLTDRKSKAHFSDSLYPTLTPISDKGSRKGTSISPGSRKERQKGGRLPSEFETDSDGEDRTGIDVGECDEEEDDEEEVGKGEEGYGKRHTKLEVYRPQSLAFVLQEEGEEESKESESIRVSTSTEECKESEDDESGVAMRPLPSSSTLSSSSRQPPVGPSLPTPRTPDPYFASPYASPYADSLSAKARESLNAYDSPSHSLPSVNAPHKVDTPPVSPDHAHTSYAKGRGLTRTGSASSPIMSLAPDII